MAPCGPAQPELWQNLRAFGPWEWTHQEAEAAQRALVGKAAQELEPA